MCPLKKLQNDQQRSHNKMTIWKMEQTKSKRNPLDRKNQLCYNIIFPIYNVFLEKIKYLWICGRNLQTCIRAKHGYQISKIESLSVMNSQMTSQVYRRRSISMAIEFLISSSGVLNLRAIS